MIILLVLLCVFLTAPPTTEGQPFCYGHMSSYRAAHVGELTEDNLVLFGHVVATFQRVQNFSHCFSMCKRDCRCRSFNLPMAGTRGDCELNDANRNTVVLVPRRGWRYHHIETSLKRQGTATVGSIFYKKILYSIKVVY